MPREWWAEEVNWDEAEEIREGDRAEIVTLEIGDSVNGRLLGSETIKTRIGASTLWKIETRGGGITGLFGSYDLDAKLGTIEPGSIVRIERGEDIPLEGRPKPMKTFRVRVAKS